VTNSVPTNLTHAFQLEIALLSCHLAPHGAIAAKFLTRVALPRGTDALGPGDSFTGAYCSMHIERSIELPPEPCSRRGFAPRSLS
jgi:hypothetical protein